MVVFGSFGDCLQAFHSRRVDAVKKGVTVVEFGMNN